MPTIDTSTTSDNQLLSANPNLSVEDIKSYNVKKAQLFKLTIVICSIYGTLALIVLLLTLFTSKGNLIFTEEIRPFTLTFVGGMIFVIIILIIQVVTFKPNALTVSSYDPDICPDFWKLVPTPKTDPIYKNADASTKGLMTYQCVPDNTIFNTNRVVTAAAGPAAAINPYGQSIDTTNNITYATIPANLDSKDPKAKLVGTGTNGYMTGLTNTVGSGKANYGANKLQCDKIFPNLLANKNANDSDIKDKPYALSCAYADACGIPWTNVCGK